MPPGEHLPFSMVDNLYDIHAYLFPKVGDYYDDEHIYVVEYNGEKTFNLEEDEQTVFPVMGRTAWLSLQPNCCATRSKTF